MSQTPSPYLLDIFARAAALLPGQKVIVKFDSEPEAKGAQRWLWKERQKAIAKAPKDVLEPDPLAGTMSYLEGNKGAKKTLVIAKPSAPRIDVI